MRAVVTVPQDLIMVYHKIPFFSRFHLPLGGGFCYSPKWVWIRLWNIRYVVTYTPCLHSDKSGIYCKRHGTVMEPQGRRRVDLMFTYALFYLCPHQHAQAPPLTQRSRHSTQPYLEILVQERDHVTLTTQIMSVAHVLGRL